MFSNSFKVDDEITFRRGDNRVLLSEITNTTPTKNSTYIGPNFAWQDNSRFPPESSCEGLMKESESPLYKKTPQGKGCENKTIGIISCQEESDEDNDDTVAFDSKKMKNTIYQNSNKETMNKLASFNIAKYTEADMQNARKEWQQDACNLEEAVSIADKLLVRATQAETARQILQSELKTVKSDLNLAQEELLKEKEESSIIRTQTRALTHTLHALENEIFVTKTAHEAELKALGEKHEQQMQGLKTAFDTEKAQLMKDHVMALLNATEQAAHAQRELKSQQDASEAAIAEAKQKVYAKVKAQFDNGNKEFNRIKGEKEAVVSELQSTHAQLQAERLKFAAEEEVHKALRAKLIQTSSLFASVLKEALPGAQYVRAAKLLEIVQGTDQDAAALKVLGEQARDSLATRAKECADLQHALKTLHAEVDVVKKALEEKGQELNRSCAASAITQEQHAALKHTQGKLQDELIALQKEKESQMLAVAKLATTNAKLEAQVEALQAEKAELDSRNVGLRQMNEEVMAMLEKMHGI